MFTGLNESAQLNMFRRLLADRRGADSAITIQEIGLALGHRSRRETETFIELHLGELPFCVVASSRGYFRPASAEDINHYRAALRSRIRCLAIRRRTVARSAAAECWPRAGDTFSDQSKIRELSLFEA